MQNQLPHLIHVLLLFFSYVELYFFPYTSVCGFFLLLFNLVQEIALILDIFFFYIRASSSFWNIRFCIIYTHTILCPFMSLISNSCQCCFSLGEYLYKNKPLPWLAQFIDNPENKREQMVSWLLNHMYAVYVYLKPSAHLGESWKPFIHWFSEPVRCSIMQP